MEKIEVLKKGEGGLAGFTWKETRTLYGKTAEETMTITDSVENSYYITEAQSHGSKYVSKVALRESDGKTRLSMSLITKPISLSAKILWGTLGFLFSGETKKALQRDLDDIKAYVETAGN